MSYEPLADMYRPLATAVCRAGLVHPVAVEAIPATIPDEAVALAAREHPCDPALEAAGAAHVKTVAARSPGLHDGRLAVLDRVEDGVVHASRSGYLAMLATCDALRAEYLDAVGAAPGGARDLELALRTDGVEAGALPLRAVAHLAAGGDPLRTGTGRAAAVGVTVVVTLPAGGGRRVVLGRRRRDVATDPGRWDIAPSGMLEPQAGDRPVLATASRELEDELGLRVEALADRLQVVGLAYDLLRLRPELCLRLDLTRDESSAGGPTLSDEEFEATELADLGPDGLERLWRTHPPHSLTPAAAGALALLETDRANGLARTAPR